MCKKLSIQLAIGNRWPGGSCGALYACGHRTNPDDKVGLLTGSYTSGQIITALVVSPLGSQEPLTGWCTTGSACTAWPSAIPLGTAAPVACNSWILSKCPRTTYTGHRHPHSNSDCCDAAPAQALVCMQRSGDAADAVAWVASLRTHCSAPRLSMPNGRPAEGDRVTWMAISHTNCWMHEAAAARSTWATQDLKFIRCKLFISSLIRTKPQPCRTHRMQSSRVATATWSPAGRWEQ